MHLCSESLVEAALQRLLSSSILLKWGFLSEPFGVPSPYNYPLFADRQEQSLPHQGSNTALGLLVSFNTEVPCQINYHNL